MAMYDTYYETIAVSLFARLPPRALLADSPLARDSNSTTFTLRIFEQKRDSDSCSTTFSLRIFEQKRDCSQSILLVTYLTYLCRFRCHFEFLEDRGSPLGQPDDVHARSSCQWKSVFQMRSVFSINYEKC